MGTFLFLAWLSGIRALPRMGERQVDMEVDDIPAEEMDVGEPSTPREEPVLSAPTNFSVLQGQPDRMAIKMKEMMETQAAILGRQSNMEDMLREILGCLPPLPDIALWVAPLYLLLWHCIFGRHCGLPFDIIFLAQCTFNMPFLYDKHDVWL
jgi:hypothetical protein